MNKLTVREFKETFKEVALDDMLLAVLITLVDKYKITKEDLKISLKALYDDAQQSKGN